MPLLTVLQKLSRLRAWLFLYATRLVEFVNTLLILGFSTAFIIDSLDGQIDMYRLTGYADFAVMQVKYWFIFWLFGFCQLLAMCFSSKRSNKASAMLLMTSGIIWAVVAGAFITSHRDFITTAPYIYTIWSAVTCFAGYELLSRCKHGEQNNGGA